MKCGSLFAGVGGWDIAADWMGWETVFQCEKDEFCQKVLKYYWPKAILYGDIKQTDFTIHRGLDLLTGSFPCQGFSVAGKRKGAQDDRYLWPEMLRAVREIEPTWVVAENVGGIISSDGGVVFEQVHTDLEAEGYEVQAFVLPAAGVETPHRRDRVWFVAYNKYRVREKVGFQAGREEHDNRTEREETAADPKNIGCERTGKSRGRRKGHENNGSNDGVYTYTGSEQLQERTQNNISENREEDGAGVDDRIERQSNIGAAPDTTALRMERGRTNRIQEPQLRIRQGISARHHARTDWSEWPTESPLCSRNDDISTRLVGITFSKYRTESIKAFGNAVVPELVYEIFKVIDKMNKL